MDHALKRAFSTIMSKLEKALLTAGTNVLGDARTKSARRAAAPSGRPGLLDSCDPPSRQIDRRLVQGNSRQPDWAGDQRQECDSMRCTVSTATSPWLNNKRVPLPWRNSSRYRTLFSGPSSEVAVLSC